jgi:putative transposase
MRDLAGVHVRYKAYASQYRRLHVLLRREGWVVNHKLVYRIYHEENLQVRTKTRKKQVSRPRVKRTRPTAPNQHWSMDFVHDQLADGRRFRCLTLVDHFSRESPAIEVGQSLTGQRVVSVLQRLAVTCGLPEVIFVDNGTEFTSKAVDRWAYENGVKLEFSRPGKPTDNAFIESFNGRLREECLNQHWFASLDEAKQIIEEWRQSYNRRRPHSSLDYLSPAEYLSNWTSTETFETAHF